VKHYVSEFEQWLAEFKKANPDIENKQQEGRSLLWDKRPDQVEKADSVVTNRQHRYVYYK